MTYETSGEQWRAGSRRLDEAPRERLRTYTRVAEAVYEELRRRLGSSFVIDELVDLYEDGTLWAQEIAMEIAPDDPWAWEPRIVVDAAFGRYVREASDYAGGRRLTPSDG